MCPLHSESYRPICFHLILTFIMLQCFHPLNGQEKRTNALDLYTIDAPVRCSFTALDKNDSLNIYANLKFDQDSEKSGWINYSWTLDNTIFQDSIAIDLTRNSQMIQWTFEQDQVPSIITLSLQWKSRKWTFQQHFPVDAYHPSGGVALLQSSLPMMTEWINLNDSLQVTGPGVENVFVYFYGHPFDPARSPMAVRPGKGSSSLSIDSIFVLRANTVYAPMQKGLYFFQSDSTSTEGISVIVTDPHFPKPREISDLTEPLVYITTRKEYENLQGNPNSKSAFDKFWLSTVGSPEKARVSIRNFYRNVEAANTLFTSYKEGWKTDRGMIYIVMGPPISVTKQESSETWSYQDWGGEPLDFVFKKIQNIFSNNHYELFRDESYERTWFLAVDQWRNGRSK